MEQAKRSWESGARRVAALMAGASAALAAAAVPAADWPSRPLRMVVPLSAGSGADIAGRIVARSLSDALAQPVVVDNRPGAGGVIGTQIVARAPADGHTLMVQSASHASNPALYRSLPYDSLKDLIDVALLGITPYVMVTQAGGAFRSVKDLIAAARAKPGELAFASAGTGSVTHLAAEQFAQLSGVKMIHVPFKGSPEAITDTAAGRVAFYMAPINTAIGLVRENRLGALGVSTARRAAVLPDVPTLAELGIAGYDMTLWFGLWTPAGTPAAVVQRLNSLVARAQQQPEVRDQFARLGIDPAAMSPAEFAKFVRAQIATSRRIVEQAKIELQ